MKKMKFISMICAGSLLFLTSCDEEDPFGSNEAEAEAQLAELFVQVEGLATRMYNTVDRVMRDSVFQATDSTSINGGIVQRSGANVTINFGNGSAGNDGVIREGEIALVMTGNDFLQSGTQVAGSFNNYKEDDQSVGGSFSVANQGNNSFSMSVTNLGFNGEFSLTATKTIDWQAGFTTSDPSDDIFELSGSSNGIETETSNSLSAVINEKFIFDASCQYGITQGLMDLTLTGDSLNFNGGSIDFISSDGCNNIYQIGLTNDENASISVTKTFESFL